MSDGPDIALIQAVLVGMLDDLHRVCAELDVAFWIDGGTLLGARRGGVLLAWDDDIDVAMLRPDLARFRSAVGGTWFAERYDVVGPDADPRIMYVDLKVYHRGSHVVPINVDRYGDLTDLNRGLYLDIVAAEKVSGWRWRRRLDGRCARLCDEHRRSPLLAANERYSPQLRARYRRRANLPRWAIAVVRGYLGVAPRLRRGRWLGLGRGGLWGEQAFARSQVLPLGEISLAGADRPAPRDVDAYLSTWFGPDFMTPPPDPEGHHATVVFDGPPTTTHGGSA